MLKYDDEKLLTLVKTNTQITHQDFIGTASGGIFLKIKITDFENNTISILYENVKQLTLDSKIVFESQNIYVDFGYIFRKNGFFEGRYNFISEFIVLIYGSPLYNDLYINKIFQSKKEIIIATKDINNDLIHTRDVSGNLVNFLNSSVIQLMKSLVVYLNFGYDKVTLAVNAIEIENNLHKLGLKLYEEIDAKEKDFVFMYYTLFTPYLDSIYIYTENPEESINQLKTGITPDIPKEIKTQKYNFIQLLQYSSDNEKFKIRSYYNNLQNNDLSIDYSDYSNFIKFSSASDRINIFKNKVQTLESYFNAINVLNSSSFKSLYYSQSLSKYNDKINEIFDNFDGYEYFLYFDTDVTQYLSGSLYPSTTAPKNSNVIYPTTSSQFINWFQSQSNVATLYDSNNFDRLTNIIPSDAYDNSYNSDYVKIIKLVGHYTDNLYLYINGSEKLFDLNNDVDKGLPKILIPHILNSKGLNFKSEYTITNLPEYFSNE